MRPSLSPKMGRNEDKCRDNQKTEGDVHDGEDPPGKIVKDEGTHEARNEREIPFDLLARELPEVIFPRGERTIDACGSLESDESASREVAYAE